MKVLLPGLAAVLLSAGGARADLLVSISEDGGTAYTTSTTSGGLLTLNGTYSGVADYTFSGLVISSTLGSGEGMLNGTGTVASDAPDGVTHSLTIIISDDSFTQPAGPHYLMDSSSSYTALATGNLPAVDDSFTFKSFATPGSVPFGTAVPSPGANYDVNYSTDPTNPGYAAGSDNESSTSFSASAGYTLTEQYVWTSHTQDVDFSPTGSTIVNGSAVPEPSSLALIGLGTLGLVAARRRRLA